MKTWYPNELSKLANVSVRTLHHYDSIGLLVPSLRLDNGFRVYSETDLLNLQRIIALKYLGFNLKQIKTLLQGEVSVREQFVIQADFLKEKAQAILHVQQTLSKVIDDCQPGKSIPWETIIQLIEVYRMTEVIDNKCVAEILNQQELKQYTELKTKLKKLGFKKRAQYKEMRSALIRELEVNLKQDPESDLGADLGERFMSFLYGIYGKEYTHLRTKIWEQGFKERNMGEQLGLSKAMVDWLGLAARTYWRRRVKGLVAQIGVMPQEQLKHEWYQLLDEMYGNEQARKEDLIDRILAEDISEQAREWLKKLF